MANVASLATEATRVRGRVGRRQLCLDSYRDAGAAGFATIYILIDDQRQTQLARSRSASSR